MEIPAIDPICRRDNILCWQFHKLLSFFVQFMHNAKIRRFVSLFSVSKRRHGNNDENDTKCAWITAICSSMTAEYGNGFEISTE